MPDGHQAHVSRRQRLRSQRTHSGVVARNDVTELDRSKSVAFLDCVCWELMSFSYPCKSRNLDPWQSVYMGCASLSICWKEEDPDDVVLEDVFCHFQRTLIMVPPFSENPPKISLAHLAIDFSTPHCIMIIGWLFSIFLEDKELVDLRPLLYLLPSSVLPFFPSPCSCFFILPFVGGHVPIGIEQSPSPRCGSH